MCDCDSLVNGQITLNRARMCDCDSLVNGQMTLNWARIRVIQIWVMGKA